MPGRRPARDPGPPLRTGPAAGPPIAAGEAPIARAAARDSVMLDLIRLGLSRTHAAPPGSERPACRRRGSRGPRSPDRPGHTRGERSRCLCRRSMTASRRSLRRRCGRCSLPSASSCWSRTGSGRGLRSKSRARRGHGRQRRPQRGPARPTGPARAAGPASDSRCPGPGTPPAEARPAVPDQAHRRSPPRSPPTDAGTARWRSLDKTGNVRLLDGDEEEDEEDLPPTSAPARTADPAPSFQEPSASAAAAAPAVSEPSAPEPVTPAPAEPVPPAAEYTPTEIVPAVPAAPAEPALPAAPAEPALAAAPASLPWPPRRPHPSFPQHRPSPPGRPPLPGTTCPSPTTTSCRWLRCGHGCACSMRPRCTSCSTTRRHTRAGQLWSPCSSAVSPSSATAAETGRNRPQQPESAAATPWRSTHHPRHRSRSAPSSG